MKVWRFWLFVGRSGLALAIAGMAIAAYVGFSGKGTPLYAIFVLAPGVVLYQLSLRMMIREAKKEQKTLDKGMK